MNSPLKVVMLCGDGQSSRIVYNALKDKVNIERIIMEEKPSQRQLVRRRIKNIGPWKTLGQVLFIIFNRFAVRFSKLKIERLIEQYRLDDSGFPSEITDRIGNINDEKTCSVLKKINPDVVIVNGTRILSEKTLDCVDSVFINTHMGITPKYRGVHGGYWALAQNDANNCGVTVHLVDKGIDTGGILYQQRITTTGEDNFNTYPIHQIAQAIPLIERTLDDIRNRCLRTKEVTHPSQLWYHPTIFQYLKAFIANGVK